MKLTRNFFQRPLAEQLLFFKAALLLELVVLGLALFPYKSVLARVNSIEPLERRRSDPDNTPEYKINWAVATAGRYIPGAKCLAMALTLKTLYAREGYPAELVIGVDKVGDKQIKAHAWIKSQGKIVIGNLHDLSRFKVLESAEND